MDRLDRRGNASVKKWMVTRLSVGVANSPRRHSVHRGFDDFLCVRGLLQSEVPPWFKFGRSASNNA
jgi:hypothetical protein